MIADGKISDIEVGLTLAFPAGSIVVLDSGYVDYELTN